MTYNVFKRPMFKRGGTPAQGTGIMSHVEPRVQAAGGYFPNTASPQPILDPRTLNSAERGALGRGQLMQNLKNFGNRGIGAIGRGIETIGRGMGYARGFAGLPALGVGATTAGLGAAIAAPVAGLAYLNRPENEAEANVMKQYGPVDETWTEDMHQQYNEDRKSAREQATTETKDGGLDVYSNEDTPPPKVPDKKAPPTEKDIMSAARSEIENEAKLIKDLLRDGDYSKGEMALLIAESLATPGGFNKKLETARKLGGEIAKTQRKEDKAITLEAYKRFKEKERETIKAGKLGDVEKILNERINLGLKNSKKTKSSSGETLYDGLTVDQYREKIISSRLGEDKYNEMISRNRISQEGTEISRDIKTINELQAKQKISPLNKEDLAKLIAKTKRIKGYSKLPGFSAYGISLDDPAYIGGYSSGGRVNYAEGGIDGGIDGGEDTVDEIITSEVAANNNETAIKPVQKLSYQELRARLPREITDDVVALISNNEQALQDFAYLQTQQDVGGFNVKYGVNLVLPPQA